MFILRLSVYVAKNGKTQKWITRETVMTLNLQGIFKQHNHKQERENNTEFDNWIKMHSRKLVKYM